VSRQDLIKGGGQPLFRYHPSLHKVLQTVYPDFPWDATRFIGSGAHTPFESRDPERQKELLEKVGQELGVREVSVFL